jgi:hypothetical protein
MSCSPTELSSRLTNIDEVILISALGEYGSRKQKAMDEARLRQRF